MSVASSTVLPRSLVSRAETATTSRSRFALLFAVLVLTSATAATLSLVSYLRPLGAGDMLPTLDAVAPVRTYVWTFYVVAGLNLVVGAGAAAIAGWVLTPGRGARLATVGGSLIWLGGAAYAVGVGGWAAVYYFASDTTRFGTRTTSALVDRINADTLHILAVPIAGALLILLGIIVLGAALWRARTVPRWVVLVGVGSSVATFLVAPSTAAGVAAETISAGTTMALGWYAWRRSAERRPALTEGAA